ncbi:phosphoinositide-specific phospholipase c-like phosphodiesterases superfamily [Colletotrichum sojae]|uniref:Phosphoinositide-specific phospholipase c-like phosphodiesterases superfamily n=1 Tax=Colletotrichum sojae TaxID=2175907 RepID=A0A8H6J258_9PEZI|nr:phosphoinositide-specific phospholipase c-like phosphodiesterases superfamily [Colletotrichum sojae]
MRAARFLPLFAGIAAAAACNGNAALCGKKYSDVTFVGSHNSAFVGIGPAHNQMVSVTDQLDLGVRFLQAQTQNKNGQIQMCHTDCALLDVGPLSQYLDEITGWINAHPNEVVTLLLTNIDKIPIKQYDDAFKSTQLDKYVFRPKEKVAIDKWPTLQQLIDAGTRLVVFMDYNSDTSQVDYILDEFKYFWETPFGETDSNFPRCNIDRPNGLDPNMYMYIVNHFLNIEIFGIKIPDLINAPKTNSLGSIDKQVNLCRGQWGKTPNVILGFQKFDWINVGEAIRAQNQYNA